MMRIHRRVAAVLATGCLLSTAVACKGALGPSGSGHEDGGTVPPAPDGAIVPDAAPREDPDAALPPGDPPDDAINRVTLPVEVIGEDGTVETITVHASDVSSVTRLYLRAHSVGYPYYEGYDVHKASLRLNDGAWVDVSDDVAECRFPESQWECIDGPYHTLRFEIPIDTLGTLRDGANTISFRFNWASPADSPDGHGDTSTGYRILGVRLLDAEGGDAIDGTAFVWDDPGAWTAPDGFDDAEAYEAGRTLWHARDTLVEGWGGPGIRAACADCHAEDGRDLAYFAYSNHSIVERSRYHGLSEEQGRQIAAYIRSYVLRDVDTGTAYDPPGRPWEPPYQPGPTARATRAEDAPRERGQPFSEVSSQLWAAGAGLAWALDRDADMWPYVQGDDGVFTDEDVAVGSTLNMRELPMNLQFPDWNEWLPVVHPLDLFGEHFENGYEDADPWNAYVQEFGSFERCWEDSGGDPRACADEYGRAVERLYHESWDMKYWAKRDLPIAEHFRDLGRSFTRASVMKWQAVKQWELVHTHDLADEGRHWAPNVEPLTWIGDARQVFEIPPHLTGQHVGPEFAEFDLYLDTAWYQLQVIMNSGRGIGTGIRPTDWRYQFMHINGLEKHLGIRHSMRFVTTFVKVNQNCDVEPLNGNSGGPRAWHFRRGHCDFGAEMMRRDWVYPRVDEITGGRALEVYEALLRANFEGFGRHPVSAWSRQYGERGWEPEDFTPSLEHDWHRDDETPSHYFRTLHELEGRGAAPELLDSVARWGERMNPRGDWERWFLP
jgi:hypothetical protein